MMTRTNELVSIPDTEKQFSDEWLAFEVVTLDDQGLPLRGRLLANSPDRDTVWEVVLQVRPRGTYVVWTGERPPKGMGFVL
jgi:hypothetical protein